MANTEQDLRLGILNTLLTTPHRQFDAIHPLHQDMAQQDPRFYVQLAAWYNDHGDVRDHKEMFVVMLCLSAFDGHRDTGLALLRDLPPYEVGRVVDFIHGKAGLARNVPRSLAADRWTFTQGDVRTAPEAIPDLATARITNHDLLDAIRALAFDMRADVLRPVDFRNLGAEELGGVYESLLALTPQISADGARFAFAEFSGNERKTSGSYYTPDSLVQCLLDSALDPVVEEAIRGKTGTEAENSILAIKVCDPAVGSGHFLVGAAHRLARHLAPDSARRIGR